MARIIIVTGTPGVGKTVLASLIAKESHAHLLNLGELVKRKKLYSSFDQSTRSFLMDERRVHRRLVEYFDNHPRETLVIDTHSVGGFIPKKPGMIAIVLRLDPIRLARRLKARKWSRTKIWDNVEAELIDVSLYESVAFLGRRRVCEIDTTGKRPRQILNEALRVLSKSHRTVTNTHDWLARYDPIELARRIH